MGWEFIVLLVLLLLNAFFGASEMALVSVNDNKIRHMAENGNRKAAMVHQLLSEPSRFLATIQIGITLTGFLASAFAAASYAGRLANVFYNAGVPVALNLLQNLSMVIITLLLSYFTLVFGELVPKRLALQKAETIAFFAAVPLTWLSKITFPFVRLLTLTANMFIRFLGLDPHAEEEDVTEEEIRMMVDAGKEKGTIQDAEKEMINNIFEFDNKTVSDIMTHRTNIVAVPADFSLKETVHIVNVEKYTRLPVFEDNLDHIIGTLHVKDLIQFLESGDKNAFNLREMVREPYYVLESTRIDQLFRDMQKNNIHMAVAIDEYGGTDGIVTIEDLIEEIVGNIFDEYDEPELDIAEIEKVDPYHFVMRGTTSLYEVAQALKIELPTQEFDTLSGFLLGQLGHIPGSGERPEVHYQDIAFLIEQMDDRRIERVQVHLKDPVHQMD